jgi:Tfp pilus assembly protein PilV
MRSRWIRQREAGSSLIEVLIAVLILGITVSALVGGVISSILTSRIHRDDATGDTVIRSYAEQIEAAVVTQCATSSTYTIGYTPPSFFTAAEAPSTSCPPTTEVVTLSVSAGGGTTETMQILLRRP